MDRIQQNNLQIVYCPYIFLNKVRSATFSDITVRNLDETLQMIKDDGLRVKVRGLMEQNRVLGKPIKDIGIIEIGGRNDFHPLNSIEKKRLNEFRAALFLAGTAKCNINDGPNAGLDMLTSENFRIVFQNFKLESPYTGYTSGVIVRTSDFGYKISEIAYEKPPYVLKNSFSCDVKFLKSLEQCKRKNRKFYRLIIRATDALMNAYSNSEDVSNGSRILELSRAFEILFELPEKGQRKEFKKAIHKYCEPVGEKKRRYLSERPGNNKEIEIGSPQVMWADRFYVLRNHIIHGERIKDKSFFLYGQLHCHLGLWFFLVYVKQRVNESLGKTIFYDSVKCESGKFVYDSGYMKEATERAVKTLLKMRKEIVK